MAEKASGISYFREVTLPPEAIIYERKAEQLHHKLILIIFR